MLLTRRESIVCYILAAVLGVGAALLLIDCCKVAARWIAG